MGSEFTRLYTRSVDETAPGVPSFIPQEDSVRVGDARDRTSIRIPEPVANQLAIVLAGRTSDPNAAVFVAQPDVIALTVAVNCRQV